MKEPIKVEVAVVYDDEVEPEHRHLTPGGYRATATAISSGPEMGIGDAVARRHFEEIEPSAANAAGDAAEQAIRNLMKLLASRGSSREGR